MSDTFQIIDKSIDKIRVHIDDFSSDFYDNLLRFHPEFKSLFRHADMAEQKKMLAGVLVLVIRNWQKPQLLSSTLKKLGSRHVKYGVLSEYYPLFGKVLLATLEQHLGSDWNAQVRQAWLEAFSAITKLMLEGGDREESNNNLEGKKGYFFKLIPKKHLI